MKILTTQNLRVKNFNNNYYPHVKLQARNLTIPWWSGKKSVMYQAEVYSYPPKPTSDSPILFNYHLVASSDSSKKVITHFVALDRSLNLNDPVLFDFINDLLDMITNVDYDNKRGLTMDKELYCGLVKELERMKLLSSKEPYFPMGYITFGESPTLGLRGLFDSMVFGNHKVVLEFDTYYSKCRPIDDFKNLEPSMYLLNAAVCVGVEESIAMAFKNNSGSKQEVNSIAISIKFFEMLAEDL